MWATQAATTKGWSSAGGFITRPNSAITYPPGAVFSGAEAYDAPTGWASAQYSINVTPVKSGLLSGALSSRGCYRNVGSTGYVVQFSISYTLIDNDTGAAIATGQTSTPAVTDSCMSISLPVVKVVSMNTNGYKLVIANNWSANINGVLTPWYTTSSWKNLVGTIIYDYSPLAFYWNLDLYY